MPREIVERAGRKAPRNHARISSGARCGDLAAGPAPGAGAAYRLSSMLKRWVGCGLLLACLASGPGATRGFAETTVIGNQQVTTAQITLGCTGMCTAIQSALGHGWTVTAPAAGRITAWWALGASSGVTLRVAGRIDLGALPPNWVGKGTSAPENISQTVTEFPTDLPVSTGDYLGLTVTGTGGIAGAYGADDMSASLERLSGGLPDGFSEAAASSTTTLLEMAARFAYEPVVTSLDSAAGRAGGSGPTVVITGQHLTDSTGVMFGTVPAAHFTIDSNTQITATAPPAVAPPVDVTVVGPGGTSPAIAADRYAVVQPAVGLNPGSVNFTVEPIAKTSGARTVTLFDTGTGPLMVQSVAPVSGDLADFATPTDGCSAALVAPGASCTVTVTFTPGALGTRSASLRFADDAPDSPQSIPLIGTGTAVPRDTTPPRVTGYGLSNRTFRAGPKITAPIAKATRARTTRHPAGTVFHYVLSEPARAVIAVQRTLAGRRKGARCVAPTAALRHAKSCTRVVSRGSLTRTSRAGRNRVAFTGRLTRKALAAGRYRAVLTAADAAGNRSKAQTIAFAIASR
jgi:hypothetical protein